MLLYGGTVTLLHTNAWSLYVMFIFFPKVHLNQIIFCNRFTYKKKKKQLEI